MNEVRVACRVEGMIGPVVVEGGVVHLVEDPGRCCFVAWVPVDPDGPPVFGERGRGRVHYAPPGVEGPGVYRLVGARPREVDLWVSEMFLVLPPHPSLRPCTP
jgi:hypothetical protein